MRYEAIRALALIQSVISREKGLKLESKADLGYIGTYIIELTKEAKMKNVNLLAEKLAEHQGHDIEIATYGRPGEKAQCTGLECNTCNENIFDSDIYDLESANSPDRPALVRALKRAKVVISQHHPEKSCCAADIRLINKVIQESEGK